MNGSSTTPFGGVTSRQSQRIRSIGLTVGWMFARPLREPAPARGLLIQSLSAASSRHTASARVTLRIPWSPRSRSPLFGFGVYRNRVFAPGWSAPPAALLDVVGDVTAPAKPSDV